MSSETEVIETTVSQVTAELAKRGLDPDDRVTIMIGPGELTPGRRASRARVIAAMRKMTDPLPLWLDDVIMNRKSTLVSQRRRVSSPRVPVTVRLPAELVAQIDSELEQRMVPVSRNNWLLEAAVEKLRRTNGGGRNGSE